MKNKVKIVTALLITALCTTSAYAAENLIKNDSFETELLGTNGWRFSGRNGWVYENENSAETADIQKPQAFETITLEIQRHGTE